MHLLPTSLQTVRNNRLAGITRLKALAQNQQLRASEINSLQKALNVLRGRAGSLPVLLIPGHTGSSLMADPEAHWGWETEEEGTLLAQLCSQDAVIRPAPTSAGGRAAYGGVFVAPGDDRAVTPQPADSYLQLSSEWKGDPSWPERSLALTQVAQGAALCVPGGLVMALLNPSAKTLSPDHFGSLLSATQILGIFELESRHLWVMRRRSDSEFKRLSRIVTGQHVMMRESFARIRAQAQPLQNLIKFQVNQTEHLHEGKLESSRASHLGRNQNVSPGYAERRPGGLLHAYWGEWMTIRPEEHAERIGLMKLKQLAIKASSETARHDERPVQELKARLERAFPCGLLSSGEHPARIELERLAELKEHQASADPFTQLTTRASHGPINTSDMTSVGLEQDAAEAALYAEGYAISSQGWIPAHSYYDHYVMELIRELPAPQSHYQKLAVNRQEERLRQALETGRAASHTWMPSDPIIPPELILAFVSEVIHRELPQLTSHLKKISAAEAVDEVNPKVIKRSYRTAKKSGAPLARALNQWIAGQQPEGVLGVILRQAEAEFHSWMEERSEEELSVPLARRDENIRPEVAWPTRPTQHLLAGWNRQRIPKPWQQAATWRFMSQRRGINAMRTGAGKTMTQIMAMLSQVRLGHRAAMIVPTDVIGQWRDELLSCTYLPFAVIGAESTAAGQWSDTGSAAMIDLQLHRAISDHTPLILITEQAATRLRISDETLLDILKTESIRFGQYHSWFARCLKLLEQHGTTRLGDICCGRGKLSMSVYYAYRSYVTQRALREGRLSPRGNPLTLEALKEETRIIREEQNHLRFAGEGDSEQYARNQTQLRVLSFIQEGLKELEQAPAPLQTSWDELNITSLTIDELHEYKGTTSGSMNHVRYAGSLQYATRAQHMLLRARAVQARRGATLGATATPWKNSLQDIYNQMDIVHPELWSRTGITGPEQFLAAHMLTANRRRQRTLILNGELQIIRDTEVYLQRLQQVAKLRGYTLPSMDISRPEDTSGIIPDLKTNYVLYQTAPEAAEVIRITGTDPVRSLALYGDRPDLLTRQSERIREEPHKESQIRRLYAQEALGEPRILELITQRAELDMEMIDPVTYRHYISPKVAGLLDMLCEQIADGKGGVLIYCDITNMSGQNDPNPNGYNFHEKLRRLISARTGLNQAQIGIMNGASTPNPQSRYELAQQFNTGAVSILIGNEISMGQGHNLQGRTAYVHHLDQALNPARQTQRIGRAQRIGNPNPLVEETMHLGTRGLDVITADRNRNKRSTYDQLWLGSETSIRNPELEAIPSINRLRLLAIEDSDIRHYHEQRLARREERDELIEQRSRAIHLVQAVQIGQAAQSSLSTRTDLHPSTVRSLKSRTLRAQKALTSLSEMGLDWEQLNGGSTEAGIYSPGLGKILRDNEPVILNGLGMHLSGEPPMPEPDLSTVSAREGKRLLKQIHKNRSEQLVERSCIGFGHLHIRRDTSGKPTYGVHINGTYVYGSPQMLEESIVDLDGSERVSVAALSGQQLPQVFWPKRDQDWDDGIGEYLSEHHDGIILVRKNGLPGIVERGGADYTALMTGRYRSLEGKHEMEGASVIAGPQMDLDDLRVNVISLLMEITPELGSEEAQLKWLEIQRHQQLWPAELEILPGNQAQC